MKQVKPKIEQLLVTAVALMTGIGGFIADFSPTHVLNPNWPPHARFHGAETILLGLLLSATALWLVWRRTGDQHQQFLLSVWLAGMYWVSQSLAWIFPGTAFQDPQDRYQLIGGVLPPQIPLQTALLVLLGIALWQHMRVRRTTLVMST
jgi:hypothetical protein